MSLKLIGTIELGKFHIAQESEDFFSVNYRYSEGGMTLAGSAATLEEAIALMQKREVEDKNTEYGTQGFASELAEDGDDDGDDDGNDCDDDDCDDDDCDDDEFYDEEDEDYDDDDYDRRVIPNCD
jgi:hypothetical protein